MNFIHLDHDAEHSSDIPKSGSLIPRKLSNRSSIFWAALSSHAGAYHKIKEIAILKLHITSYRLGTQL